MKRHMIILTIGIMLLVMVSGCSNSNTSSNTPVQSDYKQTISENDMEYDGIAYNQMSPEDVVKAYVQYSKNDDIQRLNLLWYGDEIKYSQTGTLDWWDNITDVEVETTELFPEHIILERNEKICKLTYKMTEVQEDASSLYIHLTNDGKYWRIKSTFTG